jgi:putative SOS response-associated peptidase YedK
VEQTLKEMRLATFNARGNRRDQANVRDASKSKRCLTLASGYYEWHDAPGCNYFMRRDGQPITFAGLWSSWNDKEAGNKLRSCTRVIAEPNKFVAELHDRMPVILEAKDFEQWELGNRKDAAALMKPPGEDVSQKWTVSKRANSSRAT